MKSIALVSTEKKRARAKGGKEEKEVEKEEKEKKKKRKIEHRSNNRASASFQNTDALLRSHVDITSPHLYVSKTVCAVYVVLGFVNYSLSDDVDVQCVYSGRRNNYFRKNYRWR